MRSVFVLGCASCVALSLSCSDYNVRDADGVPLGQVGISVDPQALTFGPARTGQQEVQTFTVSNLGFSVVEVAELRLDVGGEAFTVQTDAPFTLEPNASHTVDVAFVPAGQLTFGQVTVVSDDPVTPEVPVELEGLGEVPALEITPGSHVFPTICDDQVVLTMENVGVDDLVITGMSYESSSEDLQLLHNLSLPVTLPPQTQVQAMVQYRPDGPSVALAELEVESNDPRGVRTADQQSEAAGSEVTETFEVQENPSADILFAVDKSCSMNEEARNLGIAFEDFITEIDQVTNDWRIGVVTKDHGCFNRGVITAKTPNYENVFLDAVSGFQPFADDDLTEALLELVDISLRQTGPAGCNAGFVRGNAVLHVVAVSDEPEQSGQPWSHWITRWQNEMSDPNLVMVSAVVDSDTSGDCGQYGTEYIPAAQGTGGVVLDVCTSAWGNHASALGVATANSLDTFLLSALPDPTTLEVTFDGKPAPARAWSYDDTRNAIVLNGDLPAGTEVGVNYQSIGC
ncbi:MAG: choice-of-anchor D domain-containing protein [Myxococcales bacterium]|nr:choice-of-anchor D domain-containing protein [Myxococcales bacterium]